VPSLPVFETAVNKHQFFAYADITERLWFKKPLSHPSLSVHDAFQKFNDFQTPKALQNIIGLKIIIKKVTKKPPPN